MAGKSANFESSILNLIFLATAITNLAQDGVTPITDLYFSLHTADPVEASTQNTNEVSSGYTNYARVAVARSASGFNASSAGSDITLVADVVFAAGIGADNVTVTHSGIGAAVSGATALYYSGPMTPNITVTVGITPRIAASGTTIAES